MEQINEKFKYVYIALAIIFVFNLFGTCSSRIATKNRNLEQTEEIYTKEEMDIILEIERFKIAKSVLYDWNTVVRTTVRPDDRMNEYDEKIDALQKQLIKLNAAKNNPQLNAGQ